MTSKLTVLVALLALMASVSSSNPPNSGPNSPLRGRKGQPPGPPRRGPPQQNPNRNDINYKFDIRRGRPNQGDDGGLDGANFDEFSDISQAPPGPSSSGGGPSSRGPSPRRGGAPDKLPPRGRERPTKPATKSLPMDVRISRNYPVIKVRLDEEGSNERRQRAA